MKKEEALKELKTISKGEGGSWLYGFILMGSGIIIIVLGMLELLNYTFVYNLLVSAGQEQYAALMPIGGVMNFVVGMFAIVAGFGLIIDQEWAWGMSMLILVFNIILSVVNIIQTNLIIEVSPSEPYSIAILGVSIALIIVSIVGLIYLGLTKYRYA